MSLFAYYLTFDRPVPGLGADTGGRSFARHYVELDGLARNLGLAPLERFFSTDCSVVCQNFEGDSLFAEEDITDEVCWHDPEEGLSSFGTLSSVLRWQPGHEAADALPDLDNFVHALRQARHHDARFYLAIDF